MTQTNSQKTTVSPDTWALVTPGAAANTSVVLALTSLKSEDNFGLLVKATATNVAPASTDSGFLVDHRGVTKLLFSDLLGGTSSTGYLWVKTIKSTTNIIASYQ